jgi:hypothetical protein
MLFDNPLAFLPGVRYSATIGDSHGGYATNYAGWNSYWWTTFYITLPPGSTWRVFSTNTYNYLGTPINLTAEVYDSDSLMINTTTPSVYDVGPIANYPLRIEFSNPDAINPKLVYIVFSWGSTLDNVPMGGFSFYSLNTGATNLPSNPTRQVLNRPLQNFEIDQGITQGASLAALLFQYHNPTDQMVQLDATYTTGTKVVNVPGQFIEVEVLSIDDGNLNNFNYSRYIIYRGNVLTMESVNNGTYSTKWTFTVGVVSTSSLNLTLYKPATGNHYGYFYFKSKMKYQV